MHRAQHVSLRSEHLNQGINPAPKTPIREVEGFQLGDVTYGGLYGPVLGPDLWWNPNVYQIEDVQL